jgi:hypothetical protein
MEIGVAQVRRNAACLIVEVPDPGQIADPTLRAGAQAARDTLRGMDASVFTPHATKPPIQVTVTGQFFLDETHARTSNPGGGRGAKLDSGGHCASNLWELHPVFAIQ